MSMTGIDIASHQASLDVTTVPCDFVIIKATEGVNYVNPYCDTHYQQAKRSGKLRGVYHFARNRSNSAEAEADFFVKNITGYIKDAVLVLDWEDGTGVSDVAWAKRWLDRVTTKTGVRPLIYMSASPAQSYAWETVAHDYGLWIAGYPDSRPNRLSTPACPYKPGHGWNLVMWQYTSTGRINGYGSNLDMDVAYMDATTWHKYANPASQSSPVPHPTPTPTPHQRVQVDGYWGSETTCELQKIMGTTVDGIISSQPNTNKVGNPGLTTGWEWVQPSRAAGSRLIAALQKRWRATPDGFFGPASIRAMQRHFGTTVDGHLSSPSAAIMALQRWINQQ